MNFPYPPICQTHDPRQNKAVCLRENRPLLWITRCFNPPADRDSSRSVRLCPCFGREHGRNKGEFKSFSRCRGLFGGFSSAGKKVEAGRRSRSPSGGPRDRKEDRPKGDVKDRGKARGRRP